MKVPPLILFGLGVSKVSAAKTPYKFPHCDHFMNKLANDTVSFSSNAKYAKKYATLPDDIRQALSMHDGIDMLKDMELVAAGRIKRGKIEDSTSIVYVNPWLSDYYVMVTKPENGKTCAFYGERIVADVIWQDKDNPNIQIIKKNL